MKLIRRSSSISRGSRRNSISSTDSQYESNNHEMFSGAASELIPSSITSLHYPHNFGGRRDSHISRETSPLLSDHDSIKSGISDEQANFRFFSPNEIETAQGGSTLENPEEEPIDYNTNWEYSNRYDEEEEEVELQTPEPEPVEYDRRRSGSFSERQSVESTATEYEDYPAKLDYQRYYLAEEDLVIGIAGYRNCWWKKVLYYLICICTFGLGYLVLRWFPRYRVNLMGSRSPLGVSHWVVLENEFGELQIIDVKKQRLNERLSSFMVSNEDPVVPMLHSFVYRYIKFYYNPLEDIFKTNTNWYDTRWLNVKTTKEGISQSLQEQRLDIFDENKIEIDEKSVFQLLMDEVLHPFYVFQVFSIFLWLADNYYYYASCIFIISLVSIVNSLIETKSTINRLKEISKFSCETRVWRNGFWKQIDSSDLVPGDVFEVDSSLSVIPCDALLINGECVVNESMLTGESVPVTKFNASKDTVKHLPENFIDPILSKSYLFNGTKLLKMRSSNDEPVSAMVLKTGFNTTKGSLVRSMLFPKPTGFKFYEDSFKYIGFMTLIAAVGFTYSTYNFIKLGVDKKVMILRALDIITIVVPPALPATLTIGTTFAISRLKKLQIFCIAPTRVNIAGKLDVMCFDKTGTLTEDGLDVLGIHLANNAKGRKEIVFEDLLEDIEQLKTVRSSDHDTNNGLFFLGCLASCHSLRNIDNELLGDPLDVKMFEFTKWEYKEEETPIVYNGKDSYRIVKEFEFLAPLRRMSVIVNRGNNYIFTKGAPEIMLDICHPNSIPTNFDDLLYSYTHSGYRVIACAYKEIKDKELTREEAESDLTFAGFIVFENKLKHSTKETLRKLNQAEIRTIMCTGDNILTAISVSRECELIPPSIDHVYIPVFDVKDAEQYISWQEVNDPDNRLDPITIKPSSIREEKNYRLAITGDVFRFLLTEIKNVNITQNIIMNCDIFARMSPDEKHELVEQLQKIDYTVGFCGDGANDCGALKAADVGISLSEAEASVAAPFTSRIFEITCVLDIIKEGRSSLVTSFSCFKYMSLYSAIQFISVTILYKTGTNLGDFQFLYIDLFLILPLAIFMSWSKPFGKLIVKRPTANLVSPKILIPLICHIIVLLLFQVFLWLWVKKQDWYIRPIPGSDDAVESSDNTVLFLFSNFQYILIAIVLSQGPPYRESMIKNVPFIVNIILATLLSMSLFFIRSDSKLGQLMQLTDLSSWFYSYIIMFAVVNLFIMLWGEETGFPKLSRAYKRVFQRSKIGKSKKLFKNLKKEFTKLSV